MTRAAADNLGERFERVFKEELACVRQRWRTVYDGTPETEAGERRIAREAPTTKNELVGLAFSGGGIRSATLNMGIAQALHRRGVFDHVDYMSTVSGGGYLGSSISTAMRRHGPDGLGDFPYEYQEPEAATDETTTDGAREVETKFLTWVRNNSNYMTTGGLLDWPRIFAVLLRGILANFLVLLPILLALAVGLVWFHGDKLAAWEASDQRLLAARTAAADAATAAELAEMRATGGDSTAWARATEARRKADAAAEVAERLAAEAPRVSSLFRWAIGIAGLFLLAVLAFSAFIRVYKVYKHRDLLETGEESSVASRGGVEVFFAVILVAVVVAAALEALPLLIRWFHRIEGGGLRELYAGVGSGCALAVFTAAGKALSKLGGLRQKIALALVGLLGLVIPLVVALYVADDLIYPVAGIGTAGPPTPAYLVTTHQPMELDRPFGETGFVRLLPGVLLLIMGAGLGAAGIGKLKRSRLRTFLTLIGMVVGALVGYAVLVGASKLLAVLCGVLGVDGIRPDVLVLAMAVMVLLFCWATIDVNLTGVLGLYRDRLAAAYLIGLRRKTGADGNESDEQEIFVEPDLNLDDLCGGVPPDNGGGGTGCQPSKAPYHILNTALNLQGSKDPMLRDRGSDFFMFSKLYYGGHRTGYCKTGLLEKVFPQMDLPTAMAISAAAASPNAGRMTSKPLVALMTLLNVRLGYWVPHPGRLCKWLQDNKITTPELHHRWGWRIPPWALLREMVSGVDEEHKWVNLSDGGHIENMAVYELLRRRCKYIICGDGEADPDLTFGGLATLLRSARIDMGIEIEILLDDLRLGEHRASYQHAALGRIKYPPLGQGDRAEEGYLLYIKSSFTGDEDETMQEYRAKSADFPHETTADQFFDEGQFEAYRALGFHMADGLFPPRRKNEPKKSWPEFVTWFHNLRADLAPRLSAKHTELQEQLRRIQKALVRKEYRTYYFELHPELPEARVSAPQAGDETALTPEITYMVGQQLALMENAFVSLNLDQPRNWHHEGNQGWKALFERWARSPRFAAAYEHLGHLHSGRFQNFCHRAFDLPDAAMLWKHARATAGLGDDA